MSEAVACTVSQTCRIANSNSSELSTEEDDDATLMEVAIGRGRGVRLVKSTGGTAADTVDELIRTEEPAVEPEVGFAAFDGPGLSTSITTSVLCFVLRTGGFALTAPAAGGPTGATPDWHATRTW